MENLSNISKIRKFVSGELKNSGLVDIYSTYWIEMENSYLEAAEKLNKLLLETFFVDYLTIQNNGVIPKRENLFSAFVNFYQKASKFQDKTLIIKNIFRYSVYYLKILFSDIKDDDIRVKIKKINAYKAVDAYPFLMEVFEDFEFAHINRAMLLEILDTVIGFIEERNSKKPSQIALSFAGLSGEINKMLVLKDYTPRFVVEKNEYAEGDTINSLMKA
ncbi:MAG: hypothetical protein KHX03_06580 [Clostridium sp.]|nr:hypothetical protein [Clostridium sp.]